MTRNVLIAFLRNDLRLVDHPILSQCTPSNEALQSITHVLPVYVFDQQFIEVGGLHGMQKGRGSGANGARTRVGMFWRTGPHRAKFIARSVFDMRKRLQSVGSDLSIWAGQPHVVLQRLVKALQKRGDNVHGVWMGNEPFTEEHNVEQRIRSSLADTQVPVKTFDHRSLILRKDLVFPIEELPDVFTQFRKRVEAPDMFRDPLPAPDKIKPFAELDKNDISNDVGAFCVDLAQQDEQEILQQLLQPLNDDPNPIGRFKSPDVNVDEISAFPYKGGETEALKRLEYYFTGGAQSPAALYKETRNGMLGTDYSTKFSASLALGLLSPRTIAQRAVAIDAETNSDGRGGGYWIIFELLWRDYFFFVAEKFGSKMYTLTGIEEAFNSKAAQEKQNYWKQPSSFEDRQDAFVRWANGETGVPLIDANMKELALTGFMSNRGRQNVASLITKDLTYDWRLGAEWFESQLLDYDPASNYGNWQYVAGVGNDPRASRQFNPIKQGKDYDKEAKYIKTWLPVLKELPSNDAHHPWTTQQGSPDGYPREPVCESGAWKGHYSAKGRNGGKGGIRGGGGGGGKRGGGKGYNSHRGGGGGGGGKQKH